jgi:hypothetical protein
MSITPRYAEGVRSDGFSTNQFVFSWHLGLRSRNVGSQQHCLTLAASARAAVPQGRQGNDTDVPIIPDQRELVSLGLRVCCELDLCWDHQSRLRCEF